MNDCDWLIDQPWLWWSFVRTLGLGYREDAKAIAKFCVSTGVHPDRVTAKLATFMLPDNHSNAVH